MVRVKYLMISKLSITLSHSLHISCLNSKEDNVETINLLHLSSPSFLFLVSPQPWLPPFFPLICTKRLNTLRLQSCADGGINYMFAEWFNQRATNTKRVHLGVLPYNRLALSLSNQKTSKYAKMMIILIGVQLQHV